MQGVDQVRATRTREGSDSTFIVEVFMVSLSSPTMGQG
jgi:hypothetical protein